MKGYLIVSWNPWDCQDIYKKVFLDIDEAEAYIKSYVLDNEKEEEELEIHEVEVG